MEKSVNQRLLLIAVVLLLGVFMLYPPTEKLRPGLDIAGGFSMIFEIEEDKNDPNPNIAEDMKRLLQKRVDPKGVLDITWRVHGKNRIEVQMPLPPAENKALREAYLTAQDGLFATNVERSALERVFQTPAAERPALIEKLASASPKRSELITTAAQRFDAYTAAVAAQQAAAASQPQSAPASQLANDPVRRIARDAQEALEDAVDAVLDSNFDPQRFRDVLELDKSSPIRSKSVEDLEANYPNLKAPIATTVAAYDAWRAKSSFLEGPADLRRLLKGAGILEFRILAEPSPENVTKYDRYRTQLLERGPSPMPGDTEQWLKIENPISFFNLESPRDLERFDPRQASLWVVEKRGSDWFVLSKRGEEHGLLHRKGVGREWRLTGAHVTRDQQGRRAVGFNLDAIGGEYFGELTGRNIGKQLCIIVDDVAYSTAEIQSKIKTSGQISGDFSNEKLQYLIQTMQAGSLPARLKDTPVSERTIGSSLGDENLRKAFRSGVIGTICVMVLMMGYYLVCGAIANVALLLNIMLTLAAMAMLGARFTLAGIAGVVLTVGMAVDANVLIFERMREEKERGASLRMMIKNGYEKAFVTILDSNLTTLLTAVIIYYVGSEEIKGFGLTLGWGIATSMFTALFVTRTIFMLLMRYNLIKDVKMMSFIGVPKIDWYGLRRVFVPLSAVVIGSGLIALYARGARDTLDVEFLGGTNAEIEFKAAAAQGINDETLRGQIDKVGREIAEQGRRLSEAVVAPLEGAPTTFTIRVPGVSAARLAAMVAEPLTDGESGALLQRDGVEAASTGEQITVRVRDEVTRDQLETAVRALSDTAGDSAPLDGENIARANIGLVTETPDPRERGRFWNIITTVTNKRLVQHALVSAFGDNLQTQQAVAFTFRGDNGRPYPITSRRLEVVAPELPPGASGDLTDFQGGAAIWLDQLAPPQSAKALQTRLRNMRLQPDYANLPWRTVNVFGVTPAGQDSEGDVLFSSVVIASFDPTHRYEDSPDLWLTDFAEQELALARATLETEQTLRKVTQFKPQIASQSQTRAGLAMLFSWAMIIGYLWLRFGKVTYGVAGVIALVHDVLVALAVVGISGWIGGSNNPLGRWLLIEDFKIDMTVIAALMTIIGYSINDTIVIFDRIREIRGRLGVVSPQMINDAVNQCMSRTILTSLTVITVITVMYIFGGSSIRGFNFCMIVGCLTGVYSTVAIAAPILLLSLWGEKKPTRASAAVS